jgi:hypothetical protein
MSGGVLKSRDLNTSQTSIKVYAGGNAEINAKTLVDAKVKAGGPFIYGKPMQINKKLFWNNYREGIIQFYSKQISILMINDILLGIPWGIFLSL